MNRTYHGSCHCGAVRFEAELDLAAGTTRCNCSVCFKSRFWKTIARANAFRLTAGEGALSDYTFGSNAIHHRFCSRCGVKLFGRGKHAALGGVFYAVNVAALDDANAEELANAPLTFEDGRHDRWQETPDETRLL